MARPAQITFRNIQPSWALEAEARTRAAWLQTLHPNIVGCRVLVEIPHRHRSHGRHVCVHIGLSLHEPTLHGALKDIEEDEHRKDDDVEAVRKYAIVAVHEAFDTASQRLQAIADRQRDEAKSTFN